MSNFNAEEWRKEASDRWAEYARDPRTTEELIRVAISDWDKDYDPDNWPTSTAILSARGDRKTLDAVKKLCASPKAKERAVGAYLVGEFGLPERKFPAECIALLLEMLAVETDVEVLNSICSAFGHQELDAKTVEKLSQFKNHPHEDVRFGVVQGLLFCRKQEAISSLIDLTRDSDEDVRDWATFGIGQIIDGADEPEQFDTPVIRQALYDRLDDERWETGFEALAGLALRRDVRIVDRIVRMLAEDNPMANDELCEGLKAMRQHFKGDPEMLKIALSRCNEDSKAAPEIE